MKRECVFKCQTAGRKFSVIVEDNPNKEGEVVFWAYEGRKKLDPVPWLSLAGAIGSILCEQGVSFMADLRRVWG